jgi:hypothetical protein
MDKHKLMNFKYDGARELSKSVGLKNVAGRDATYIATGILYIGKYNPDKVHFLIDLFDGMDYCTIDEPLCKKYIFFPIKIHEHSNPGFSIYPYCNEDQAFVTLLSPIYDSDVKYKEYKYIYLDKMSKPDPTIDYKGQKDKGYKYVDKLLSRQQNCICGKFIINCRW